MSVGPPVCLSGTLLQIDSSFLFLKFYGRQFSLWHSTKCCSLILDLVPLTPKIYSPKFGTKSPINRLVWQIYCRCLGLLGGFRGWPIQWNHAKCCYHGNEILANFGYFCKKLPISQLVWQIDRTCFGLPGGRPLLPWQ